MPPSSTLIVVPFQSHLRFSLPLCKSISKLIGLSGISSQVLDLGHQSLGFLPDADFLDDMYAQIETQVAKGKQRLSPFMIAVFPELADQAIAAWVYLFDTRTKQMNQPRPCPLWPDIYPHQNVLSLVESLYRDMGFGFKGDRHQQNIVVQDAAMEIILGLGLHFAEVGQLEKARSVWVTLPDTMSSYAHETLVMIGQSYAEEGAFDRAEKYFSFVIEHTQNDNIRALAHYNRGVSRSKMCQWTEAINDYEECLRISPGFELAYNNIGASYMELGNKKKAREWFEKCLSLQTKVTRELLHARELAKANLAKLL